MKTNLRLAGPAKISIHESRKYLMAELDQEGLHIGLPTLYIAASRSAIRTMEEAIASHYPDIMLAEMANSILEKDTDMVALTRHLLELRALDRNQL